MNSAPYSSTHDELSSVAARFSDLLWFGLTYDHTFENKQATGYDTTLVVGDLPHTLYWQDIDYKNQERSNWDAAKHYTRIQTTLTIYGKDRLYQDETYRDTMIAALRFWVAHDYTNPNWWHNEIGMPRTISDIALMMWDVLPQDLREDTLTLISRGSMKCHAGIVNWTGANLIWGINNTIKHAILTQDADLMTLAAQRAWAEMQCGKEGIQPDGAFRQHGKRWYSGGYGAAFTYDVSVFLHIFQGTHWQFSSSAIDLFLHHVLDGQRVMSKNGYFDYCGVGREFARYGNNYRANLHRAVDLLARTEGLPRAEELRAFSRENKRPAAVCDDSDADITVFYPSIQLLCHRKNGSYIGVKGHNDQLYDQELCNGEGELAYNMSYGTHTCLSRRGDEYFNMSPLWDFAHIPGTTAREETDAQILAHRDWWNLPLPNNHAGGLTLGDCGILYEKPEHDGISAYVSFFTFDGCLAALGADITDQHPERGPLSTTVDQCHAVNPCQDHADPPRHASNGEWCYFNLDDKTKFRVRTGEVVGSWHRNNSSVPDKPVKGNLFLLDIPTDPAHPQYAYLVAPNSQSGGGISVRRNDSSCQAILVTHSDQKKTLMAVFHRDATLELPDGKELIGKSGNCLILPL